MKYHVVLANKETFIVDELTYKRLLRDIDSLNMINAMHSNESLEKKICVPTRNIMYIYSLPTKEIVKKGV